MCELFGVCTPRPIRCNELLEEFFSHGERHPDGWGMATFRHAEAPEIYRSPEPSHRSSFLRHYLTSAMEREAFIAHIRHATAGRVCMSNTHPFALADRSGRVWTLAHNGTIFRSRLTEPYAAVQQGSSDSERILCCLVAEINRHIARRGRPLPARQRFAVTEELVHRLCPHNVVNLLLHDGELMYVHTNRVGRLHMNRSCGFVFSTQPLRGGHWTAVPLNTLLACRRGRLVFRGREHHHTFDERQDYTALLRRHGLLPEQSAPAAGPAARRPA